MSYRPKGLSTPSLPFIIMQQETLGIHQDSKKHAYNVPLGWHEKIYIVLALSVYWSLHSYLKCKKDGNKGLYNQDMPKL